jgi:hypothetical protein
LNAFQENPGNRTLVEKHNISSSQLWHPSGFGNAHATLANSSESRVSRVRLKRHRGRSKEMLDVNTGFIWEREPMEVGL